MKDMMKFENWKKIYGEGLYDWMFEVDDGNVYHITVFEDGRARLVYIPNSYEGNVELVKTGDVSFTQLMTAALRYELAKKDVYDLDSWEKVNGADCMFRYFFDTETHEVTCEALALFTENQTQITKQTMVFATVFRKNKETGHISRKAVYNRFHPFQEMMDYVYELKNNGTV